MSRPVRFCLVVPMLFAVAVAVACADSPTGAPRELTELPRALSATETRVIDASNVFAFGLFRQAATSTDSNTFMSPLSVSMALGMTMNGAAGTTLDSMRVALGLEGTSLTEINGGYRSLIALLRTLDRTTDVRIANSVWYQEGSPFIPFDPAFLDATKEHFGAQVKGLDFGSPSAVTTINDWVDRATVGKIDRIIDEIASNEVMFLINAIYFKGAWRHGFDRKKTVAATFNAAVGGAQTVPMMRQTVTPLRLSNALFEAVDLPYGNSAYSMTVLLPREGISVEGLIDSITPLRWAAWSGQFQAGEVVLQLPKFRLEYDRELNDDLTALGMGVAFDRDNADFSPMTTDDTQLFITNVKHKTFVDVSEQGTEAAAVTAVGVGIICACGPPPFVVDRPFVFLIRERLSGTILFMGKIVRIPE